MSERSHSSSRRVGRRAGLHPARGTSGMMSEPSFLHRWSTRRPPPRGSRLRCPPARPITPTHPTAPPAAVRRRGGVRGAGRPAALDERAGLDTATFVSGYPGSPLGTLDLALGRLGGRLDDAPHRATSPGSTRSWPPPPCGARRWARPCPTTASTAWSAPGTARGRGSTAAATCSSTPTSWAPARTAAPCCSSATTRRPSRRRSRTTPTRRSPTPPCRCSCRPTSRTCSTSRSRRSGSAGPAARGSASASSPPSPTASARSTPTPPASPPPSPSCVVDGEPWHHEPSGTILRPDLEELWLDRRLRAAQAWVEARGLDRFVGAERRRPARHRVRRPHLPRRARRLRGVRRRPRRPRRRRHPHPQAGADLTRSCPPTVLGAGRRVRRGPRRRGEAARSSSSRCGPSSTRPAARRRCGASATATAARSCRRRASSTAERRRRRAPPGAARPRPRRPRRPAPGARVLPLLDLPGPHAGVLQRVPAQPLDGRARGLDHRRRRRLPRDDPLRAPPRRRAVRPAHADGRRGRALGRPRARSSATGTSSRTSATARSATRAASPSGPAWPPASTSRSSCSTTRPSP